MMDFESNIPKCMRQKAHKAGYSHGRPAVSSSKNGVPLSHALVDQCARALVSYFLPRLPASNKHERHELR